VSQAFASVIDALHALFMVTWVLGLPLLFWRRWPRLTKAYGVYVVVFIVLSQASHYLLGECFLTALSRYFWQLGGGAPSPGSEEWFTVRFAWFIFGLSPSHRSIVIASEALISITALGILFSMRHLRSNSAQAAEDRIRS